MDRVGRKMSMTVTSVLTFMFLLPLIIHQPVTLTTALLFGARMFANGTYTIASIYAPEVFSLLLFMILKRTQFYFHTTKASLLAFNQLNSILLLCIHIFMYIIRYYYHISKYYFILNSKLINDVITYYLCI